MKLNKLAWSVALGATLLFVACGGGGGSNPPRSNQLPAGKYIGTFTIEGSTPFVTGNYSFTIDEVGNLNGTTRANSSSGAPNEAGTLRGTIKAGASFGLVELDLSYASPTLGQYTTKGSEVYSTSLRQFAFAPNARNTRGDLVGRFFLIGEPE